MLAHEFKIQREQWGFSTALIAKLLCVNERTVQRWESGAVPIQSANEEKIQAIFEKFENWAFFNEQEDIFITYEDVSDMLEVDAHFFQSAKIHRACVGLIYYLDNQKESASTKKIRIVRFDADEYFGWLEERKDTALNRQKWAKTILEK